MKKRITVIVLALLAFILILFIILLGWKSSKDERKKLEDNFREYYDTSKEEYVIKSEKQTIDENIEGTENTSPYSEIKGHTDTVYDYSYSLHTHVDYDNDDLDSYSSTGLDLNNIKYQAVKDLINKIYVDNNYTSYTLVEGDNEEDVSTLTTYYTIMFDNDTWYIYYKDGKAYTIEDTAFYGE